MRTKTGHDNKGIRLGLVPFLMVGGGKVCDTERCICCGEPIPEGRQICPRCEEKAEQGKIKGRIVRPSPEPEKRIRRWARRANHSTDKH